MKIIELSEAPDFMEEAIDYFYNCWSSSLDYSFVRNCIFHSTEPASVLPKFYLLLYDNKIIGSYALLYNDLISRQDLMPWFGCLYINEDRRNKGLAGKLIKNALMETKRKGFDKLYLKTLLIGFYEYRGWSFLGNGHNTNGQKRKIYFKEV